MTLMLPCLMAYELIGQETHEILGLCIVALFILHHAINWKWHRNLFRGKYVIIQLVEPARISAEVADISVDVFLTIVTFGNENPTEPETVTLGGKEFRRIITDSTFDGTPVKRVYYARKEGEFIITVTISELTMEGITAREKNFTALN